MTTKTTTATLSERLADWVTGLSYDDIPEDVRTVAKMHALDALGIAVASTGMDYGEAVHRAGIQLGHGEDSRVLGFGTRLPAASAALVNGTLMHGLDFDDTHIGAIYHASAPSLAAALASGEARDVDGATVLLAYVIGLEVGCRLAKVGAGKFHARGFHPTGVIGTFAAACVVAKIRGLSSEALTYALGLCGSQASGMLELHDSWLKRMHPGWAAHSGMIAATLGEAGFRGPTTVFEGSGGLYRSHIEEIPTAEQLGLDELGEVWMTTEIALKPYPCCHFTHAFVDAARDVVSQVGGPVAPGQVQRIEAPIHPSLLPMVCEPPEMKVAPKTIYDALFSVQFVVGTALTGRALDLATFYDKPLDDPEALAMAALVSCPPDPEVDFPAHFSGEVSVHLADGHVVHSKVADSHGTPQDPMTDAEVVEKFRSTAGRQISADQADRFADVVVGMDQLGRISELLDESIVPG